jgi:hypothetical protein
MIVIGHVAVGMAAPIEVRADLCEHRRPGRAVPGFHLEAYISRPETRAAAVEVCLDNFEIFRVGNGIEIEREPVRQIGVDQKPHHATRFSV